VLLYYKPQLLGCCIVNNHSCYYSTKPLLNYSCSVTNQLQLQPLSCRSSVNK
jgi:hypothetical protein